MKKSNINIALLPGWGFSVNILQGLADRLSEKYHVTLIEHDDTNLLARLPSHAILIGWSLGGLLAIKLAHQYPDRFSKVIAIATNPCFIANHNWPGVSPENFMEFEKKLENNPEKLLREFALLQVKRPDYAGIKQFMCHLPLPPLDPLKQDLREIVKYFNKPLLFILSNDDKLVPSEIGEKIKLLNPQIKINMIHQASHIPFLFKLDELMEGIHDFL